MAKKGESEGERRLPLGRPTNNVSIGIVGLPNVGKSTLFNCLTKLNVPAENYPFCTIQPNTATVEVPDERFDKLVQNFNPAKRIRAVLKVTDIAGLVKGASEGKGLGNEFLSNIQAVDAIYHVVRSFEDDAVEHHEGSVLPTRDLDIIGHELRVKDLQRVNARLDSVNKAQQRGGDKTKKQEAATLEKVKACLEAEKDVRNADWDSKDVELLNEMQLISAKPVVYLVNLSKENYMQQKGKHLKDIKNWVDKNEMPKTPIIPFSAAFESELQKMSDDDQKKYVEEKKVKSALPRIITSGYHALDLVHFFTTGTDEVRAWTIKLGTLAPGAAGVIHGDFETNFVCAETMAYADFVAAGSEQAVKAAGKYRTEGKNYVVKDGDILFIKHTAGGANKKKK